MSSKTAKIAGIILSAVVLSAGSAHAFAAAKGPIEECVANAVRNAPNLESAVNHCYWDYWK